MIDFIYLSICALVTFDFVALPTTEPFDLATFLRAVPLAAGMRQWVLTILAMITLSVLIARFASEDFLSMFKNFVLPLLMVLLPWSAINLIDDYKISRERIGIPARDDPRDATVPGTSRHWPVSRSASWYRSRSWPSRSSVAPDATIYPDGFVCTNEQHTTKGIPAGTTATD